MEAEVWHSLAETLPTSLLIKDHDDVATARLVFPTSIFRIKRQTLTTATMFRSPEIIRRVRYLDQCNIVVVSDHISQPHPFDLLSVSKTWKCRGAIRGNRREDETCFLASRRSPKDGIDDPNSDRLVITISLVELG